MAVNKVVYGEETLVDLTNDTVTPETLAEGVTAHDASGEQITGTMTASGGGGSGVSVQSDWNQTDETAADFIKNKPFGDFPTGSDTLTWDGNVEGLVQVGDFLKISDVVITAEDFANGGLLQFLVGGIVAESVPLSSDDVLEVADGALFVAEMFVCVSEAAVNVDIEGAVFPEAGVYVIPLEGLGIAITLNGYTGFGLTKKLDEKYLPGSAVLYLNDAVYLYRTPNTTDASDRVTSIELANMVNSNRPIYINLVGTYLVPDSIGFYSSYGYVNFIDVTSDGTVNTLRYYTAEYTET